MARIRKRGLDYFPMNTDFIQNRIVRRIMKRSGDGSLATLLGALSCIYADEGYYVRADQLFYEDLSATLYQTSTDQVKCILSLAVDYGLFDASLFKQYGILTSAEIQRQYLFSTKRRKSSTLDPRFCLVDDAQADTDTNNVPVTENQSVTVMPQNATPSTHSITQHNTEKHSTTQENEAKPLLNSSPKTEETEDVDGTSTEARSSSRHKWTDQDINRMHPPQDDCKRNFDGLIYNLRQFRIPPQEQYAIILKSNFGAIGHPLWKGFYALRESHGKIRQPGHYLLSLCNK